MIINDFVNLVKNWQKTVLIFLLSHSLCWSHHLLLECVLVIYSQWFLANIQSKKGEF